MNDVKQPAPITFVVAGQRLDGATRGAGGAAARPTSPIGTVRDSVRVGARRAGAATQRLQAVPGRDAVVLKLANGPELVLHPEHARDLLLAQSTRPRPDAGAVGRGGRVAAAPAPVEVEVPAQLQWRGLEEPGATRGATRGFLGDVVLDAIDIVTDLVSERAQAGVATLVGAQVDGQVDEGVYELDDHALQALKGQGRKVDDRMATTGGALLVLVHGTFSDTSGTFGQLWAHHPQRVRALFDRYGRVHALDHATLRRSPIENALTLAQACPDDARLHLLTHSRGGLVAEVLARVCGDPTLAGGADLAFFDGDALKPQREALVELAEVVRERRIVVERIVRVACPARGTLLASGRLDAYVSVLKWTLELAGVPVLPPLLGFLAGVAQQRTKPEVLPGLAAQIPDSALVRWLHGADAPVPGQLRVLAGDIEGDSLGSWVKTLLADGFYWTDNDLVVQTRSMYGGTPRHDGALFLLDQGGRVSHFNYFVNERTADALVAALLQEAPAGFAPIGPLSWAGESASGVRGRRGGEDGRPASDKPALFLLPGILGSHLKVDGKRIWLGWRLVNGLRRLEYPDQPGRRIEPDGPVGLSYDDLADFMADSHEVIEFAFDWRRPLEEEARRLGQAVDAALAARELSGQPVRIVAHSMGGLLARTMALQCPQTWDRLMSRPGGRLLMLGTPNGGSWAPMQVLSGDDTFGNTLVAFGAPFQDYSAREMMAQFPGFIQLQASLLDGQLSSQAFWQQLADDDLKRVREHNWWHADERQLSTYRWGVPRQAVLDAAVAWRRTLDAQRDGFGAAHPGRVLLVVGRARFTPDGYEIGDQGLVYLNAPEAGDGRVTLASALLPGVPTWRLDCSHGNLADEEDAFGAFLELLETGTTQKLPPLAAVGPSRGAGVAVAHVRSRPSRERAALARVPESERALRQPPAGAEETLRIAPPSRALDVTVLHGDVRLVRQPLMLGHYESMAVAGSERVVDRLTGGTMTDSLRMGQYPDKPGTHQVFMNLSPQRQNLLQMPRPEAVIVVGLGPEGKLRARDLADTVRQGTLAWAQRELERGATAPAQFDLAATIIGSGGSGVHVAAAAQLVAQGVREANTRLFERGWPGVRRLWLVELYLDRATEAWRALQMQALAAPGEYRVTDHVESGEGGLPRPLDSGYRGAEYDLVSALADDAVDGASVIRYRLDTKRARTEVQAQKTQGLLLRQLVTQASNDTQRDPQIGRTLFRLLVPLEMESYLGGSTEMLLELNRGTAGIPWELLDGGGRGGGRDERPWAIRSKLLRKLQLADYRLHVSDAASDAHALVIGEPKCPLDRYPRLAGARAEARAVAERLGAAQALGAELVLPLICEEGDDVFGPDALEVVNALMSRDWRIVHIAGHGEPPRDGATRGVVLSDGTFLGPDEINAMRVVPELVFVNCCHLAARHEAELLRGDRSELMDRSQFAAGVAEALIAIGVRCVIAAGWAVDDEPAKVFATTFYDALLRGRRFIDAVGEARERAWDRGRGGNTWAAYQCYGDPDWYLKRPGVDPQRPDRSLADEYAGVASASALRLALQTLEASARTRDADDGPDAAAQAAEAMRLRLRHLDARFSQRWGDVGLVAEAFGAAWDAAGDRAEALRWYRRAVGANDGSGSMHSSEQIANLRARTAWASVQRARRQRDAAQRELAAAKAPGESQKRTLQQRIDKAEADFVAALDAARAEIDAALQMLAALVLLQPTMERESLRGSTHKRLALIEHAAGRADASAQAIARMREHYLAAETLARQQRLPELFYPALNRIAAELVVELGNPAWHGLQPADIAAVRQSLAAKVQDDPDFWSVAGVVELALYEALADARLAERIDSLAASYADLYARVSAPDDWGSAADQVDFVLSRIADRLQAGEAKAAEALQARLRGYAGS